MRDRAGLMPWIVASLLLGCGLVHAADPRDHFVRVSARDPRYLELDDGTPFIPNGLNLITPPWDRGNDPAQRLAALDDWLTKLAANGGNLIRVWLSNDFFEIEPEHVGQASEAQVKHVDAMLALARKHGIKVKMTLEHFREIDPANKSKTWAIDTRQHVSKGGLAHTMPEWVDSADTRRQFVKKLEFLSARYRDDPTIFGWELWNEMNAVEAPTDEVLAWTQAMLPELHRLFPKQLALQSYGSFDGDYAREPYKAMVLLPGNDLAQVHRYLDQGAKLAACKGPVDVLVSDALREIRAFEPKKPILLAESGAVEPSHSGPSKLYKPDTDGLILHDVLFAPFFSGAAGTGQCWHWDVYVSANDLWWQFGRFTAATKGLDPPAESFEPISIDNPAVRVYLLKGQKTWIAWCRDKQSDWRTELAEARPAAPLEGVTVALGALPPGAKCRIYDPWTDQWTDGEVRDGAVRLPKFRRSIVVRIER